MNDRPRPFGVGGDPPGNWPRTPSGGGGGSSRQGGCWLIALVFVYLVVAVTAAVAP